MAEKFDRQLMLCVIEGLYAGGGLDDEDISLPKKDLLIKVKKLIEQGSFNFVIDHRDTILGQADLFYKQKNYEYAYVFYAMFFEHTLNRIIKSSCEKKNIEKKHTNAIIRSVDIHGKLTWLLTLLGIQSISERYLNIIKPLADKRNAFVHYKWNEESDIPNNEDELKQVEKEFKNIKLAVKYIKILESKILYNKKRKKIYETIRQ